MKNLLVIMMALAAFKGNAQMVSCNVFLQGNYVELGINGNGAFGSSMPVPTGYYANSGNGLYVPCTGTGTHELGFVADPDMDGWTVGAPPFFGDYFLPGLPFEGWSIQIDTATRCDAFNGNVSGLGFTGSLTGTNISYSSTGATSTGLWQGSLDSLAITQETSIDTGALFFTVKITLVNTSHTALNNIYYWRNLDPDNDEVYTGSFVTTNKIEHQSTDTSVVSARGTVYGNAYLALGTMDTNANCFIASGWPPPSTTNIYDVYNDTNVCKSEGYTVAADYSIGIIINVPHIAAVDSATDSVYRTRFTGLHPANSATFTYFYAFSPAAVDSALKELSSADTNHYSGLGINNINSSSPIKVYPNPAQNSINITGLQSGEHLSLVDMVGQATILPEPISGKGTDQFSLNSFSPGIYILLVKDLDGNIKSRIKVQKQ